MANSDIPRSNVPRQRVAHVPQLLRTVAARRRTLQFSQRDLAEKLGIAQSHFSDIERGKRVLSVERLLEVFNILGLELVVQQRTRAAESEW